MKMHSMTAELFQADGRTDMTKLTAAFRNFAKAPKIGLPYADIRTGNNKTSGKYGIHITLWTR